MQKFYSRFLGFALVFCLLPNFGLRAQTAPLSVSTEETTQRSLADGDALTIETGASVIVATGDAVGAAGNNVIINNGEIRSDETTASVGIGIAASGDGLTITNNVDGVIKGNAYAIELQGNNVITNHGEIGIITSATDGTAIRLAGAADATLLTSNPTAPNPEGTQDNRDAYYFNNKIINSADGVIEGKGSGHGIIVVGLRAQILNRGNIRPADGGTGAAIAFEASSGEAFILNHGTIGSATGTTGIAAFSDGSDSTIVADGIVIINETEGLIQSNSKTLSLQNGNIVINKGRITSTATAHGAYSIGLFGLAANSEAAAPQLPFDASEAARDAWYYNNKIVNEAGAVISTTGAFSGRTIAIRSKRVQILNDGDITAESGQAISLQHDGEETPVDIAGQIFIFNSGRIVAEAGDAIYAFAGVDNIVVVNGSGGLIQGGTLSTAHSALHLRSGNTIINAGRIEMLSGTEADAAIILQGAASNMTGTRPRLDADESLRDAYYSNNKVVNRANASIASIGTIDTGIAISVSGKRVQILNHGAIDSRGVGVAFDDGSGESLLVNTGTITSTSNTNAAVRVDQNAENIFIFNELGATITSRVLSVSLGAKNTFINRGHIMLDSASASGANPEGIGVFLQGPVALGVVPDTPTISSPPPAYNADAAIRDAYYDNVKFINRSTGVITGEGSFWGIVATSKRNQIHNYGIIRAKGAGAGIYFSQSDDGEAVAGESLIVNTGLIESSETPAILAHTSVDSGIVVINSGTLRGGAGAAIVFGGGDDLLVLRPSSKLFGNVDFGAGDDALILLGSVPDNARSAVMEFLNVEEVSLGDPSNYLRVTEDATTSRIISVGKTLFSLADEVALDINAGAHDVLYEHNFGSGPTADASKNTLTDASEKASKKDWWIWHFGSRRSQDRSSYHDEATHNNVGFLIGYSSSSTRFTELSGFLGIGSGSLEVENGSELSSKTLSIGMSASWIDAASWFIGGNFALGLSLYDSERSIREPDGSIESIKGDYKGYFLSPELVFGFRTKVEEMGLELVPSIRLRYLFTTLEAYTEDGNSQGRVSLPTRYINLLELRAQVALLPMVRHDWDWYFEPRFGAEYRVGILEKAFDIEHANSSAKISYSPRRRNVSSIFGGLGFHYFMGDNALNLSLDAIGSNDDSFVLRAQAGFEFKF